MAKRGKGSRVKGSRFERELANLFTEKLGVEFKRGLGQTRSGGKEVSDIYSESAEWLHIEAKRQKRCNIKAAMQQAILDTKESKKTPVVITKDDHSEILVTMRLEDFLCLLKANL